MVLSKSIAFTPQFPSVLPAFQAAGGAGVAFNRVRIVLARTDRAVALDTTVTFPDSATEMQLTLPVPLPGNAPNAGYPLVLNLEYVNAEGVVVFRGGPVTVTAFPITSDSTPPPPSTVQIPIVWVGPGASATQVVLSPNRLQADSGAAFTFTAQALDSLGRVVPNTPIAFTSADTSVAKINAATGVGTAGSKRAFTTITAQLLTGQTSTATLSVVKPAQSMIMVGGEGQSGLVNANLPALVQVMVFATDTFPSPGVPVTFAAQNGGSVGATTVVTDSIGMAKTTWRLGPTAGAHTLTASVAGLQGSPVTFNATATAGGGSGVAKALVFSSVPTGGLPGVALPTFVVAAYDSTGGLAASFSGNITVALGANPGGAVLSGTRTLAAISGVATFSTVTIDKTGAGYTLVATSPGLTPDTTGGFNVASSVVAGTNVTPALDSLTAIGMTAPLTATALDSAGAPTIGRFTWVSRNPGIATVDTAGVIKGITNGTTWVVATELGGTKDSAEVVVFQKLATIKVSPATRDIYLGASYQFTANAVDGLGTPLASQPTVTWSTSPSAIASITTGGVATGIGLGATSVQATAGAVTGTAGLNVKSQITRIVVSHVAGGTVSSVDTLASLGATSRYVATARDTLDNAMTGITFAWASSNGAVATLDSIASQTVNAISKANGLSAIRASAQGITGAAQLNVKQVLTAVDLSPTTAIVATNGQTVLLARGKDANGYFIPGGTFTFTSAQPTIATVAAGGIVTGVAFGNASITAKDTSGTITSNVATVTVDDAKAPSAISFGRDTLTVGRSGSTSIPVYLSKPSAGAVTVNLAVRDTFAFFTGASISIAAGQTSGNATLNGHNAGTTQVFATDGGTSGYAGDTAVLAVQANVKFTTTGYSLNVTDQVSTQVLLSDPSPVGGTFVTFTHDTPGRVNVSPDPAFIPAGQLASDVVLLATGTNTAGTLITPAATGVSGTASRVYTYDAKLTGTTRLVLGLGQFDPNRYVQVTASVVTPLTVALASSDTGVVVAPPSVALPKGSSYNYYTASGVGLGTAIVTASAPGWTSKADTIVVSTPKVRVSGGGNYNTTNPQFGVPVYAADSQLTIHPRTNALVVSLTSTDPSVLTVMTPTVTIGAGQTSATAQLVPGGNTGTARIVVTASGHTPDTTGVYTLIGPKLSFSWTSNLIGAGQQDQSVYVSAPNTVTGSPLIVSIISSDSTLAAAPIADTIPIGTNYSYFTVRGKSPGTATFYVTAPGYTPDTATYRVTTPRLVTPTNVTLNNFAPATAFGTYVTDSTGASHGAIAPVIVSYSSTDANVVTVTAADTIQSASAYSPNAKVTPVGVGTARVIATAPGYLPDTITYTVVTPKLNLTFSTLVLGRRQYNVSAFYPYTPNTRTSDLTVSVARSNPSVDSLSATSIIIPSGTNYKYVDLAGLATGTDTLIFSAPGYLPDTGVVIVTTPRLVGGSLPSTATTTSPPSNVYVYTADSLGTTHATLDTVIVRAASSNSGVLQPTAPGFRINPASSFALSQVAYSGPGSASVTFSDSLGTGYQPVTSNTVTVTGPSLVLSGGTTVLGMRQNDAGGTYVNIPNAIGSPLVVALVSSDPTVAQVPATVTIPTGSTIAYFQITGQDAAGTIQITATATGYNAASKNVQVTQPKLLLYINPSVNTTSLPQTVYVTAADANGTAHPTNEDVVVSLASLSPTVGVVDSLVVTIRAGQNQTTAARFIPVGVGTVQITATDVRIPSYRYDPASVSVAVNTPTLSLGLGSAALGIGQYIDGSAGRPDNPASTLTVNLAHSSAAASTASSVLIGVSAYSTTVRITGVSAGADTITASAIGHNAIKAGILIGNGRFDPISGWPTSLAQGDSALVTIYARDVNTSTHYVAADQVVTLAPTGQLQFVSGGTGPSSVVITSATIPKDGYYVQVYVKALTGSGTGSATISGTNYTTFVTPTVTVP